MKKQLKQYHRLQNNLAGITMANPVLVLGLGIPIVIMGTTSFLTALAFSIAALLTIPTALVFSAVAGKHMPASVRLGLSVILSGALLVLAADSIRLIAPGILDSLGFYYTLMAVNSVIIVKAEEAAKTGSTVRQALFTGFKNMLGFILVLFIMAMLREFFGSAALFGRPIAFMQSMKIPAFQLPFMGFILLGFLAALVKVLDKCLKKRLLKVVPREKLPAKPL